MKKFVENLVCLILLVFLTGTGLWCSEPVEKVEAKTHIYINGPSVSKHLFNHEGTLNEWHPGIGAELQRFFGNWFLGVNGHYMSEDSNMHFAYWACLSGGYRFGKLNGLWGELSLIAGGLKKKEYQNGRLSFFGLPVVSVGYKWFGINISYIPQRYRINEGLIVFQLKIRIHSE